MSSEPIVLKEETKEILARFVKADFLNKGLIINALLFPFGEVLKSSATKISFCAPQTKNTKFCFTMVGQI